MREARLFTAGVSQVPIKPLFDIVGKTGAGSPAQNGGTGVKLGKNIGLDKMTPVKTSSTVPFRLNEKGVYIPAFKPEMDRCPDAFETIVTGPIVIPLSE